MTNNRMRVECVNQSLFITNTFQSPLRPSSR